MSLLVFLSASRKICATALPRSASRRITLRTVRRCTRSIRLAVYSLQSRSRTFRSSCAYSLKLTLPSFRASTTSVMCNFRSVTLNSFMSLANSYDQVCNLPKLNLAPLLAESSRPVLASPALFRLPCSSKRRKRCRLPFLAPIRPSDTTDSERSPFFGPPSVAES